MTVTSTATSSGPFNGNGVTTVFPFTFAVASKDEVGVLLRTTNGESEVASGFSVTLSPNGGSVRMAKAPPLGVQVIPFSDPSFQQQIAFANGARYLADTVNEANDRAAMRDLVLQERVSRAVQIPLGEVGNVLPPARVRAMKLLKFDYRGRASVIDPADLGYDPNSDFDGGLDGVADSGSDYDGGFDG